MIIKEYHNFLSPDDHNELWDFANKCTYSPNWSSNLFPSSGEQNTRFVHHFQNEHWDNSIYMQNIRKAVKEETNKDVDLDSAYINMSNMVSGTYPHTDIPDAGKGISALLYLNPEWLLEWGGYTCFYKGYGYDEVLHTIIPSAGKLALFDSNILHHALPPTKYAKVDRITIAIKMLFKEEN